MKLRIRSLTGQTIDIDIDDNSSVGGLKDALEEQEALPKTVQRLIFSGHELEDDSTLTEKGVTENAVVHLVIRQTRNLTDEEIARQIQSDLNAQNGGEPGHSGVQIAMPSVAALGMPEHLVAGVSQQAFVALQFARIVKMFAIIDCIFILIWSLTIPLLIFALIMPLSGYFGTQNFNVLLIAPYMLYLIANVAFRIWFNVTSEEAIGFIILNTLGIILEVYIAFIVARFIFTVHRISAQDRDQLRNLERIR